MQSFKEVLSKGREGLNMPETKRADRDRYKVLISAYCLAIASSAKTRSEKSEALDLITDFMDEIEGSGYEWSVKREIENLQK